MSRWSDAFTKHPFQSDWKELLQLLPELKVDDESILTSVEELARLKKVIKYLEGLLNALDVDLVPLGTWDNFQGQCSGCLQQIREYQRNRSIGHLQSANANADNLLTYVRPWVVNNPADAVKSLKNALETYHATVNEYTESYRTSGRELLTELRSKRTSVMRIEEEVASAKNSINAYERELFANDVEKEGIKYKIQEFVRIVEEKKNSISQFYHDALVGDESNNSIKKKVLDSLATIQVEREKALKYVESISQEKDDLEELYLKVFGDESSNDEKMKHGLRGEINQRITQLDKFHEDQKVKFAAQFKEIEELVPGATSVGLATAFYDMRRSFNIPIIGFTAMFYLSLVSIIGVGLWAMVAKIDASGWVFVRYESLGEFASSLGWKLPLIGVAVWLAAFSSKRRSEAQRLQQEYAHKETIAKSYQSFKKQIEELQQEDQVLLKSLISKALDAFAENASKTLDGKHGDKPPIQESVDAIASSIGKLKDVFITK